MDYIEEIFNKYNSRLVFEDVLTLKQFRSAVKDIEAYHLKQIFKTYEKKQNDERH